MSHPVYRFGDFIIDSAARELWLGAQLVALPPKSFECLAYLLEHRERAVGRDELISAVWGRVDVSDALLAQTLLRARRAVNDTGSGQAAIRTVPRFGYRWVGAVVAEEGGDARIDETPAVVTTIPASDAGQIESAPIPATIALDELRPATQVGVNPAPANADNVPTRHRWRSAYTIAAAIVVLLIAASLYAWRSHAPPSTPAVAIASDLVVVLPVRITSAAGENAWIRLGAMDYIASRLRDEGHLKVLPSDQVVKLVENADEEDARGAGAPHFVELKTGAAYVLQPTAMPAGEGWNLSLDVYHNGGVSTLHAHAATPLQAAAQTVAQALESMGVHAPAPEASGPPMLSELLRRVDAATLASDFDSARQLITTATPAERASPELRVREGQLAFRTGHVDDAERLFKALTEADAALPSRILAQAQMGLGAVAVRRGNYAAAEPEYAAAIATFGNSGDADVGHAYLGRAVAHAGQQQYDSALADFGRARVELERVGDQLGAARVDANIGITESSRARYATALPDLDRAIATFTRFGVRDDLVASLLGKTRALLALVNLDDAVATSERAWQLVQPLENRELYRRVGAERVRALLRTGQLTAADATLGQIDARERAGGGSPDPDIQALRAMLMLDRGRNADALALAEPLLAVADAHAESDDAALLDAATVAIRANLRMGRVDVANRAITALQRRAESPDPGQEVAFARALGQAEVSARQNLPDAALHFESALKAADNLGIPEQIVAVASAYVVYLVDRHDTDKAAANLGRLAGYSDHDFRAAHAAAVFYAASSDRKLAEAADARERALAGERPLPAAWP